MTVKVPVTVPVRVPLSAPVEVPLIVPVQVPIAVRANDRTSPFARAATLPIDRCRSSLLYPQSSLS